MSYHSKVTPILENLAGDLTSPENVFVEIANEEVITESSIVKSEIGCEEMVTESLVMQCEDAEDHEPVTVQITVINSDGNSEVTQIELDRPLAQSLKRAAPPQQYSGKKKIVKLEGLPPFTNGHSVADDKQVDQPSIVISIQPEEEAADSDDETDLDKFKCFLCKDTRFPMWSGLLCHFHETHCTRSGKRVLCQCQSCETALSFVDLGGIDALDSLVLNVLSHMVLEHGYSDESVATMTQKIDNKTTMAGMEKIQCPKCDAMIRAEYLTKHIQKYCKGVKNIFHCQCGKKVLPTALHGHSRVCAFLRTEKACTCPSCGLLFKTVNNMELHYRRLHLNEKRYVCDTCGSEFFKRDVLLQHCYIAHNINIDARKILLCPVEGCDFSAVYPYHLNQHSKRVHEKGPFVCQRCDKICNTYYTLNRHQCVFRQLRGRQVSSHVYPSQNAAAEKKRVASQHSTNLYQCSECNFTDPNRRKVELHKRIHKEWITDHPSDQPPDDNQSSDSVLIPQSESTDTIEYVVPDATEELIYCCGDCGFTSPHETVLREHLNTQHASQVENQEVELVIPESTEVGDIIMDTVSLAHQDAEAVSLLNHFKMGNTEFVLDSAGNSGDTSEVVMEMVTSESVPCTAVEDNAKIETSESSDLTSTLIDAASAAQVPLIEQQQEDRSMLPKKSTTLAKNAPRLFHELTKSGGLIKQKTVTVTESAGGLQEYNIVFHESNDHPAPPGQVLLLSEEEAQQMMQQNQEVLID